MKRTRVSTPYRLVLHEFEELRYKEITERIPVEHVGRRIESFALAERAGAS